MKYKVKIKNPIWGTPITYLDRYNPDQFEIVGLAVYPAPLIDNNKKYSRILIKRKSR